jgi:hypothetical protein
MMHNTTNINGIRNKTQFETRQNDDTMPDLAISQDETIRGILLDCMYLVVGSIQGFGASDFSEYIVSCCERGKHLELQQYFLSCNYISETRELIDFGGNKVCLETEVCEQAIRLYCFLVEIYHRKQDVLDFQRLLHNYSQNKILGKNFLDCFFNKNMYFGLEFNDGIDYYLSGHNPFSRLYEAMVIDTNNKVLH